MSHLCAPKVLRSDKISIAYRDGTVLEVFHFSGGILTELTPLENRNGNSFGTITFSTVSDGYYFIRSGNSVKAFKKGTIGFSFFLFDKLKRDNVMFNIGSFSMDGLFEGTNEYVGIGRGIYKVLPLYLTPTIVDISGKMFYCFPSEVLSDVAQTQLIASSVRASTRKDSVDITVGGKKIAAKVGNVRTALSVKQTIFKV